jgi:predicted transcriptional regulator
LNFSEGEYTKTLRPLEPADKEKYLAILEKTASSTVKTIRAELNSSTGDAKGGSK